MDDKEAIKTELNRLRTIYSKEQQTDYIIGCISAIGVALSVVENVEFYKNKQKGEWNGNNI